MRPPRMTRFVFHSVVERVFDHVRTDSVAMDGTALTTHIGYFVLLRGSHEALFVGQERPELAPGDYVRVTIERTSTAQNESTA